LHIGCEQVDPYPLTITGLPGPEVTGKALFDWYAVDKMRLTGTARAKDRSTIAYNSRITVAGIPDEAKPWRSFILVRGWLVGGMGDRHRPRRRSPGRVRCRGGTSTDGGPVGSVRCGGLLSWLWRLWRLWRGWSRMWPPICHCRTGLCGRAADRSWWVLCCWSGASLVATLRTVRVDLRRA
jgi:hypothetical protein